MSLKIAKKTQLFWFVLGFVLVVSSLVVRSKQLPSYRKGASSVYDMRVREATVLYRQRAAEGMDFSTGPCLTNDLRPGWVVDIIHSPREPVDDLPQNQCPAFLEGRAGHFVELNTSGNVVRVR